MTTPPNHQNLADEFDRHLAKVLEQGQEAFNPKTGETERIEPSAATLSVIAARLKALGLTTVVKKGNGADRLREAAQANGFGLKLAGQLPPVDVDRDDHATGTHG
jgi:hypothetical protein